MLKYLHIENIAVIEKADIEFSTGLNVLTGETGAGKSIVIDSINAVLGERTSRELIRSGCEAAVVSAEFCGLNCSTVKALNENGISCDEDGLIISRKLSLNGKSTIRLNGQPVTAGMLKEIAKGLINIHGQHDNQALLNPENHIVYIDSVAENSDKLADYYSEFKKLNAIRKELAKLEDDEDDKQRRTEILRYQIEELEGADIHIGETEKLKEQLEIAKNAEKISASLNQAHMALFGDDDTDGAVSLTDTAIRALSSLPGDKLQKTLACLNDAKAYLEAAGADINDFADGGDSLGLDAENIGARLDLLFKLMLKYGDSEQKMLDFLTKAKQELEDITFSDKRAKELSDDLDESTQRLIKLGEDLSLSRKKAASEFEKSVIQVLRYLNMPSVNFKVGINKGRYTKRGCDEVEFLISANAGEELRPMSKIASGGELSRIMLAIKSVLSDRDTVDTLIFDEIDTGISGYTAGKVGVQLKKVSESRQVICVTHLAQIAAEADNHLLIEKSAENGRTFTKVRPLEYGERITEIARIMSGAELTENLYNSAKELIDSRKQLKRQNGEEK